MPTLRPGVRLARWGFVVAAFTYQSWLLGGLLGTRVSHKAGLTSEMAAQGEPWAWIFRLGDCLTGVIALTAGMIAAWACVGLARAAYVALAAFGAATIADSGVPLTCSPSTTPDCRLDVLAELPLPDLAHTVTSATAVLTLCAGGVLLAWAARAAELRRTAIWLGVLVGTAIVANLLVGVVSMRGGAWWIGLDQRVGLLAFGGLLLFAGLLVPGLSRR